jgi:hypothetical protein
VGALPWVNIDAVERITEANLVLSVPAGAFLPGSPRLRSDPIQTQSNEFS